MVLCGGVEMLVVIPSLLCGQWIGTHLVYPVHSDRVDLLRMLCTRQRCCIMFVGILGSPNEHDHANSW